mmetsp:Transcript_630/g.1733  ORF Transcript_630/g.1733 Transcript_630/m.1733 type:complete len:256 (-) Transcript_630:78-845(-)
MGAGLSHSPVQGKRKRYIFFSAPHVAIDSKGDAGPLARPGQQVTNCACGAMIGALGQFNANGLDTYLTPDSEHDIADPEFSIFKQRLAQRIKQEGQRLANIDLVELTRIAERRISSDLDALIKQAVDVSDADYAIVTGVQIHSWGQEFDNDEPNLELIAPTKVGVMVQGTYKALRLANLPAPSARQVSQLAGPSNAESPSSAVVSVGGSTISAMDGKGTFSNAAAGAAAGRRRREARFSVMLTQLKEALGLKPRE